MNYIELEQANNLPELRMPIGYAEMLKRDQEREEMMAEAQGDFEDRNN